MINNSNQNLTEKMIKTNLIFVENHNPNKNHNKLLRRPPHATASSAEPIVCLHMY